MTEGGKEKLKKPKSVRCVFTFPFGSEFPEKTVALTGFYGEYLLLREKYNATYQPLDGKSEQHRNRAGGHSNS